jgi:hypothetical protein
MMDCQGGEAVLYPKAPRELSVSLISPLGITLIFRRASPINIEEVQKAN